LRPIPARPVEIWGIVMEMLRVISGIKLVVIWEIVEEINFRRYEYFLMNQII